MSAAYNDGTVQYGSRIWIVKASDGSTAHDTYVADNISVNRPTKPLKRTNELGEPSGSVGVPDFVEGSAVFQLASSSTKEPLNGCQIICNTTVNAQLDSGIGSETFFISHVSRAETKDGEKKFNINFIKKYN